MKGTASFVPPELSLSFPLINCSKLCSLFASETAILSCVLCAFSGFYLNLQSQLNQYIATPDNVLKGIAALDGFWNENASFSCLLTSYSADTQLQKMSKHKLSC